MCAVSRMGCRYGTMETDHGRVKNSSKTLLKERLKAYRELLNLGEAWLG